MAHRPNRSQKASRPSFGRWLIIVLLGTVFCCVLIGCVALFAFFTQLNSSLPSTQALKNYHPPLVSSVYAADGSLIAEFYIERRYLMSLDNLPEHVVRPFLAAEDARFYEHGGLDLPGIIRASIKNLQAGEIVQGGSTITQQVVKSLLLTPERTWIRKLKEAILAYRIDQSLSKDEILELYLNQIYFGSGAYGVEAAARTYFDKHAYELTMAEACLLAGLPKAPTRFSPFNNFARARQRQRYVLLRMVEVGFISQDESEKTFAEPLNLSEPRQWTIARLNSFTEEVRRQIEARYGYDALYKEGLQIYTTVDPRAQKLAEAALDSGLRQIEKRHGYRGPLSHVSKSEWPAFMKDLSSRNETLVQGRIVDALVTDFDPKTKTYEIQLGLQQGKLPPSGWVWAKGFRGRGSEILEAGDVIQVRLEELQENATWEASLEQVSDLEGAFLAMTPETGRVLCMVGGRNFAKSQFNRATQAFRQPGSAFKPIIYAAALDKGYTEASMLIDAPIIRKDPSLPGFWKPANYDRKFLGPILLREGLIHSRNVVTIKLLDAIGVHYAIDYARRLGITSPLTPTLSLALGASGLSLQELLTAYSVFPNQGDRVQPYLIEQVLDRNGNVIERHQVEREAVISSQTAYIMTHLLQGVIQEGTGQRAKKLGRPAAGKTGTTNELKDAWFIGFTPQILAGAWVGYDDHTRSLGRGETGGRAACPIWLHFAEEWLKDKPIQSFPIPSGVIFAKIDATTGVLADSSDQNTVYAAFMEGRMPSNEPMIVDESSHSAAGQASMESFFKSDLF